MTDSRVNEQTVRRRFPYPIAAAWHRVTLATSDTERINCLIACNEVLLRTLAAFLLPDYLRGPAFPVVETAIRKLERPTDGLWLELVRETLRYLGQRPEPGCFVPEAPRWFFTGNGAPGEGAHQLNLLVELRNKIVHGARPGVSPTQTRQQLRELHQAVWVVLLGLGWLAAYRPFRVLSQEPARRHGSTGKAERFFTGKLQFFAGVEEQSEPLGAEWDATLVPDSVYLSNADASGVLELTPFLQVLPHPKTDQERLYLFRSCPGLKKMSRVHDDSGSDISKAVDSDDGEVSFESWLAMRERLDLFQELRIAGGAIRLPNRETLGDETGDLGPRYEKLEELGRGGMATVYRVHDRDLDEEVALKVLLRELAEEEIYRERFRREARRMLKIHHPRIVPVTDIGVLLSGQPFLKMPVRKGSLQDRIRPEGLPEERVRAWAEDALEALACIHRSGIVHRDVKPSNFLLDAEDHACLTDFGIALTAEESRLTRTREQMGTLAYMSPEQRSLRNVTEKADIYSLAVVLHELRTGGLPASAPGANMAGPFGELVRWMGEPEPEARPAVTQALEKLRGLETGVVLFKEPGLPPPPVLASPPALELPVQVPPPVRMETKEPAVAAPLPQLGTRAGRLKRAALGMLFLLFFVNYAETGVESWLRARYRLGVGMEQVLGEAAQWFERGLSFEPHDATNMLAVWGFSTVYYFFFPLLVLTTVFVFYRRRDPRPLLLLATAAAIDYLLTLPFYLFFPVPERWTYPDSGAVLLSDLWTSKLIQAFRPFSGLNNCFPSFHVSMTVMLLACLYRVGTGWFRKALLPLGLMIVLSTFALGIHWLSDILAGLACGLVSFRLAERLLPRVIAFFQAFGVPRAR